MALPFLLPLLLGGTALAEAAASSSARRKPSREAPPTAPRRSGSEGTSPTDSSTRVAYRALIRGDMPDPMPTRLARGLDCLISGIIAPLGRAGVSGRLVPLVDPQRGRTSIIRDGLAFGLTLDPDSTDPGPVVNGLPGVEMMPPDPSQGRDFYIFAIADLNTGAALLDHLAAYGAPVVAMTTDRDGTGLDVTSDGVPDFYFDAAGDAPGSHPGAGDDGSGLDFSALPRVPV